MPTSCVSDSVRFASAAIWIVFVPPLLPVTELLPVPRMNRLLLEPPLSVWLPLIALYDAKLYMNNW